MAKVTDIPYTDLNMVSFMYQGEMQSRFISMNPKLAQWLKSHGYKQYQMDDYDSIDMIYARSQSEAKMIHSHLVMNP